MITHHAILYLGSRLFAAATNLAAVAVFTRLAASDVYGDYLLLISWSFVIYGFFGQWLGAAFFAIYQQENAAAQIRTLARLLVGSLALAGALIGALAVAGAVSWPAAAVVFLIVSSISLFMSVMEAERTRLDAPTVSVMLMLRSILMVSGGAGVLLVGGGALGLTVSLAIANIVGAVPGIVRLAPYLRGTLNRAAISRLVVYGWPLIIAFGITAAGQNVDRLTIAHLGGAMELGSYGATSDFIKQSFGVVSEAIVLAVISIAKDAAIRRDDTTARQTLEEAFRALTLTVAFGAVFMITFSGEIVQVIFGPEYRRTASALLPWLIGANAVLIFRAFYFGQAIYFGQSGRNEVIASVVTLGVSGALSLALIPQFGIFGAAAAATAGQLAACVVYVLGRPRMPLPLMSVMYMVSMAALVLGAEMLVDYMVAPGGPATIAAKLFVFAGSGVFLVWRFDILGLKQFACELASRRFAAETAG